jgi:hypothetical protein
MARFGLKVRLPTQAQPLFSTWWTGCEGKFRWVLS